MIGADQIGGSDCEALGDGLLAQPVNAITSGAYVIAGVIVWLRVPADQRWRAGGLYALLLILIGTGSILYHGPQVAGSQFMHDAPIPALIGLIVILMLLRWRRGAVVLPGFTWSRAYYVLGVAALAGLSYLFGRTGSPLCDADSWLQLHGLWHILTAAGFVLIADMLFRAAPGQDPR